MPAHDHVGVPRDEAPSLTEGDIRGSALNQSRLKDMSLNQSPWQNSTWLPSAVWACAMRDAITLRESKLEVNDDRSKDVYAPTRSNQASFSVIFSAHRLLYSSSCNSLFPSIPGRRSRWNDPRYLLQARTPCNSSSRSCTLGTTETSGVGTTRVSNFQAPFSVSIIFFRVRYV